jgi:hypothetical protein
MILPAVTPLATQAPCEDTLMKWCVETPHFQILRQLIVRDKYGNYFFEAWTEDGRKILIPILLEEKK